MRLLDRSVRGDRRRGRLDRPLAWPVVVLLLAPIAFTLDVVIEGALGRDICDSPTGLAVIWLMGTLTGAVGASVTAFRTHASVSRALLHLSIGAAVVLPALSVGYLLAYGSQGCGQ